MYIRCTLRFRKYAAIKKRHEKNRSYSVTTHTPRLSIFAESIDLAGWRDLIGDSKRSLSGILRGRATSVFHKFHSLDIRSRGQFAFRYLYRARRTPRWQIILSTHCVTTSVVQLDLRIGRLSLAVFYSSATSASELGKSSLPFPRKGRRHDL